MNPARVIRITHVEAMRIGRRMGADAAVAGMAPQPIVDEVCGRAWWRMQEATVRTAFACAFAIAYTDAQIAADNH